jgi:hypothetical protein
VSGVKRKIVAIITAATGDRVVITEAEMEHALNDHFSYLPRILFLELVEQVLKDPSDVFVDNSKAPRQYNLFYRLDNGKYLVAVVKKTDEGSFLASMYPTGSSIRNKHKKMKRVKL